MLRGVPSLLTKSGWVEGRNISYEWLNAAQKPAALPELAAELLARKPDLIVTDTNVAAQVTMKLTRTVPMVVFFALDPVGAGLAQSLTRPGGNVTGLVWGEPRLAAKIVDFLHQALPRVRRLAVLHDPASPGIRPYIDADVAAAHALGIESREYHLRNPAELPSVLEAMRNDEMQAAKAAIGGSFHADLLRQVIDYSSRYRIATVSVANFAVQLGALLAYYPNELERVNRMSAQLDKLLRGANPSEMPFEYPSRFDLAVNLRTAKALGITIPQSVLLSATSLVE
jgi:putative ABC transport system substrate-binding protein